MAQRNIMDELQNAVNVDDLERARIICHDQLASGADPLFWRTQIAYIHFLDEKDADKQYQCIGMFRELVPDHSRVQG